MRVALLSSMLGAVLLGVSACGSGGPGPTGPVQLSGATYAIEAESEDAPGPIEFRDDDDASGSRAVALTASAGSDDASLVWSVAVDVAQEYGLWIRMRAPGPDADAARLGFDGKATRVYPSVHGAYRWVEVQRRQLTPEGDHAIRLAGGDAGVRIDVLAVVADASADADALERHVFGRPVEAGDDALVAAGGGAAADDASEASGTATDDDGPEAPSAAPDDPSGTSFASAGLGSLRGTESFDAADLSSEQRLWYQRLWAALGSPNQYPDATHLAQDEDAHGYGRALNEHDRALLYGLRASGDLRFLDALDRVAQSMRAALSDGWCHGVSRRYGDVSGRDGYLNFRRTSGGGKHYCRDTSTLEAPLVHAHLASIAYAYHVNRDLVSPSGIDYGERADFWLDYLRNHYEAKWRERNDVPFPDMPFLEATSCHTHKQQILYLYFVGSMLQDRGSPDADAYLTEARRMTDASFDVEFEEGVAVGGFQSVGTPHGDALVYPLGAPGRYDGLRREACPTTYAGYASSAILTLHFEGFQRWTDEDVMPGLARGAAHFVLGDGDGDGDGDEDGDAEARGHFAAGVTGDQDMGG